MQHIILCLTLLMCIGNSLRAAENQKSDESKQHEQELEYFKKQLDEDAKFILSQEFYDAKLCPLKDEIRAYTQKNFPDLHDETIQEKEGEGVTYSLGGLIELHEAIHNVTKTDKKLKGKKGLLYSIYWLSVAQGAAEAIEDDPKKQEECKEAVYFCTKAFLASLHLKQIKAQNEANEKEREIFTRIGELLNNDQK